MAFFLTIPISSSTPMIAITDRLRLKTLSASNAPSPADGKVDKTYGAKTTPHMYVINPAGMVVYAGAIDDKPGTNVNEIKGARNFVVAALDDLKSGKPVSTATTQPYGCSVKYKS